MMKEKTKNYLLLFFSIIISLIAAELVLKKLAPREVVNDPIMLVKATPGNGRDENGFRNDKILSQADIVAIGDSQTDGNNAEENQQTWPHVLERLSGKTVYQMAVGGYGPIQYDVLTDKALNLKPSLIIIGFYLGNDLTDAYNLAYTSDYWKGLRKAEFNPEAGSFKSEDVRLMLNTGYEKNSFSLKLLNIRNWIRSHSQIYTLLGNSTRLVREKLNLADTWQEKQAKIEKLAENNPDIGFVYNTNDSIRTIMSPAYRFETVNTDNPKTAEGWRIAQDRILSIKNKCESSGVKLIINIIPTKEMVYGTFMKKKGETMSADFEKIVLKEDDLLKKVMEFCNTNQLSCNSSLVDLSGELLEGRQIYGRSLDGHPLSPGYEIIGDNVYKYIKNKEVIKL